MQAHAKITCSPMLWWAPRVMPIERSFPVTSAIRTYCVALNSNPPKTAKFVLTIITLTWPYTEANAQQMAMNANF